MMDYNIINILRNIISLFIVLKYRKYILFFHLHKCMPGGLVHYRLTPTVAQIIWTHWVCMPLSAPYYGIMGVGLFTPAVWGSTSVCRGFLSLSWLAMHFNGWPDTHTKTHEAHSSTTSRCCGLSPPASCMEELPSCETMDKMAEIYNGKIHVCR